MNARPLPATRLAGSMFGWVIDMPTVSFAPAVVLAAGAMVAAGAPVVGAAVVGAAALVVGAAVVGAGTAAAGALVGAGVQPASNVRPATPMVERRSARRDMRLTVMSISQLAVYMRCRGSSASRKASPRKFTP